MRFLKRCYLAILSVSLFFCNSVNTFAISTSDDAYQYPVTVKSDDWFDYTVLEKNEMLRIDNSALEKMNNKQLVQAIADYPYLIDIYAYDSMQEGLTELSKSCDAYAELLSRKMGKEAFISFSEEIIAEIKESPRNDGRSEFVVFALRDIAGYLQSNKEETNEVDNDLSSVPKTPKGNYVSYIIRNEVHTAEYHAILDNEVVSTYGVILLRNGSCLYNCHSYAWYSTASSNSYWINDPSIYMTDGSYSCLFSGSVSSNIYSYGFSVNDIIYYASNSHSALFIDNPLNGAPLATLRAESKWGSLGVFEHTVSNVPSGYDYSTVSVWH